MKFLIICFILLLTVGCSTNGIPEKLDGNVLKDADGNYYIVEHKVFDIVHLIEYEYKEKF